MRGKRKEDKKRKPRACPRDPEANSFALFPVPSLPPPLCQREGYSLLVRPVASAAGFAAAITMIQFLLGFTLGNVVGMYLAQNYDIPNLAKKLEEIKKDIDAKKKPPSS
ncbi:short transmembrane mitochondrial protein 1 [Phascolarctos cinereus]|uniref:Uncharacterized protein C7orf73 homolog n=1 Tax=Phascolarctos cinereus TaxID=38626 RepID=A0A6P5LDI5_PHACI|nr:uncharacterized protein C7orf73 homolog [Phascolarctos cinereus]